MSNYNIEKNNPNYVDGRSLKTYFCKKCHKKISNYQHKYCPICQVFNQEIKISKKILIKLYVLKTWSSVKIGEYLGYSKKPILRLLKKYNIHIRTRSENQSLKVGKKHPLWKGNILREYFRFNDNLKEKIRNRDNRECQMCFNKVKNLDVHHIDFNRKNISLKNLVTLCEQCHYELHRIRNDWKVECQK
jgi:Zn finger protein HypA/HybF involved in hydrogenase expression